jgi:PAS domain S-box-containing protein
MSEHQAVGPSNMGPNSNGPELEAEQSGRREVPEGQKMPAPDLSHAVDRVERHELERRLERLSLEMDRMRKALGSLTRFRTVIDRAGEAIFITDPVSGRFVDANETALKWLGLPRDRLLSLSVSDLDVQFPLQYEAGDVDHVTDTRGAERPQIFGEGIHRRRDGTSFPVEVAIARRRFANRDLVLVVARESTARREAEQELRESEERYGTLFELTRDAIYLTSRDGTVVEVNAAAIEVFGYSRQEFLGLEARRLYCERSDIRAFQEGVEENGFVRELPVTLCRKDGFTFPSLLTATLRHTGDGVIEGYQCLIRLVPVPAHPETKVAEGHEDSDSAEKLLPEIESMDRSVSAGAMDPGDSDQLDPPDEVPETAGVAEQEQDGSLGLASTERQRIFHPAVEIEAQDLDVESTDVDRRAVQDQTVPRLGTRLATIRRTRRGEVQRANPAPWEPTPTGPVAKVPVARYGVWPTVLAIGLATSVFGWSGMVASTYPYDSGFQEWQLCVRAWGVILISLGVVGREWRRATRAVALGLILTAAVVLTLFALYLLEAPFGLQSLMPGASGKFNLRVLTASQFVAAVLLYTAPLSWFLWRMTRERAPR